MCKNTFSGPLRLFFLLRVAISFVVKILPSFRFEIERHGVNLINILRLAFTRAGINFINFLQAAFEHADPESAKKTDGLIAFFVLLESVLIKCW